MSATNSTANYELPIFLATDKPAWLTDWNGAMNAIDTAIHSAQTTADGAQTTAGTAIADIATINASLTTITGNISSLTTTVNGNTGSINTINSLIGNGQPTTEDKTLIGAINEIYGMITGGGVDADEVSYDNTASGITATNVQDAIDSIIADFDLSSSVTPTVTSAGTLGSQDIRILKNSSSTVGKVFGSVYVSSLTVTAGVETVIATISNTGLPTLSEPYTVHGLSCWYGFSGVLKPVIAYLKFKANGDVDVCTNIGVTATDECFVNLPPCLYFLKPLE